MTRTEFKAIEKEMLARTERDVHDTGHIYRVLYHALRIAKTEPDANIDVVIYAALLHDIGRTLPDPDEKKQHAEIGAAMAYQLLVQHCVDEKTAAHVQSCIATHSHRRRGSGCGPATLEAKIIYDADKLDLSGAVGCARALLFGGRIGEPFYLTNANGQPTPGNIDEGPSFFREYNRKLKHLNTVFYTKKARKIAKKRQINMDKFCNSFIKEVNSVYRKGAALLKNQIL